MANAASPPGNQPEPASRQNPVFVGTGGASRQPQHLADVLERVLDKGIVIVGDIQVRLLDIELLTIKIRLMIASVDKAREMGINWWEGDAFVTSIGDGNEDDGSGDDHALVRRIEALEQRVSQVPEAGEISPATGEFRAERN